MDTWHSGAERRLNMLTTSQDSCKLKAQDKKVHYAFRWPLTCGELRVRADAVAAALTASGLGGAAFADTSGAGVSQPRVAIVLPLTAECVPLYLGVVLAGAVGWGRLTPCWAHLVSVLGTEMR